MKLLKNPNLQKKNEDDAIALPEQVPTLTNQISETTTSSSDIKNSVLQNEPWPEHFDMTLSPFLPKEAVEQLKQLWLEGPEPPRISDNGWAGRTTKAQAEAEGIEDNVATQEQKTEQSSKSGKIGRGGRGQRGGRADGRKGRGGGRDDIRKVLTEVNFKFYYSSIG